MNARQRVFNLEQANTLLPQIELLLLELESKHDAFRRLEDELFFAELVEQVSPPEPRLQELEATLERMEEDFKKIRELGCLLRHAERGWVDFLARKDEEWIYYCWRLGEKQIQYYHSLGGGFLERQPLTGDYAGTS